MSIEVKTKTERRPDLDVGYLRAFRVYNKMRLRTKSKQPRGVNVWRLIYSSEAAQMEIEQHG